MRIYEAMKRNGRYYSGISELRSETSLWFFFANEAILSVLSIDGTAGTLRWWSIRLMGTLLFAVCFGWRDYREG